jgi:nucleoside-diphosphate-sugar epimerase
MKILLTGVPGWLGTRFLETLVKGFENGGPLNDWRIKCLLAEGANADLINNLAKIKKIEYVSGDIRKINTLEKAAKDVDIVFHMAGIMHPEKIADLYEVNTQGTKNLLTKSVEAGVKRFIYVSSSSAAGTNKIRHIPMNENDIPRPYMHYGLSKYRAENIVKEFHLSGKIETVILRPCWFYGPNQPLRQTTFFKMIKKGNPIIFGNGENLRSMSYVDNVCQGMLRAAENDPANGQTYWIADTRPYTTNEIYETIAELLNVKNYKPVHLPNFSSEIFLSVDKILQYAGRYIKEIHVAGEMNKDIACSIEKASSEIGYDPMIGLKEGMRRSIEWCRNNGINI